MSEETQPQTAADVARQEPVVSTADELNLNDLAVVLQVIDVCSKRGAFEGNELKDVGTLRERISNYVSARVPAQEESSEDTDTEGDS
jgi:hypothetical protein|tara:strand:+ start:400 stop:660 length:261 start_codon:yes stop_codon:yes gene_type:complete